MFKMKKKDRAKATGAASIALVLLGVALVVSALGAAEGESWREWFTAWTSWTRPNGAPQPPGATPTWGEWFNDKYDAVSTWASKNGEV